MIRFIHRLRANVRGAAIIEFSLAIPVLLAMLIGISQLGLMFFANAGLRQSVEEGARLATIFPRPTKQQVIDKIAAKKFGLATGTLTTPTITDCTESTTYTCWDISQSYTTQLKIVFVSTPPITLTANRRVFLNPVS